MILLFLDAFLPALLASSPSWLDFWGSHAGTVVRGFESRSRVVDCICMYTVESCRHSRMRARWFWLYLHSKCYIFLLPGPIRWHEGRPGSKTREPVGKKASVHYCSPLANIADFPLSRARGGKTEGFFRIPYTRAAHASSCSFAIFRHLILRPKVFAIVHQSARTTRKQRYNLRVAFVSGPRAIRAGEGLNGLVTCVVLACARDARGHWARRYRFISPAPTVERLAFLQRCRAWT